MPFNPHKSTTSTQLRLRPCTKLAVCMAWRSHNCFAQVFTQSCMWGKPVICGDRLTYWLNNPPVTGITHFFAERIDNDAVRTMREEQLIAEFKPVGNTLLK